MKIWYNNRSHEQLSPVSSTNKTDRNDITEILLKEELNTINQTKPLMFYYHGDVIIINGTQKTYGKLFMIRG
jgi:hypothetical protein